MDEPNLEADYSHPLFVSLDQLGKFLQDRLENDKGAMSGPELAAALYHLAINLEAYMKRCSLLEMKLQNALSGDTVGQEMMDNIEHHRQQYRARKNALDHAQGAVKPSGS